MYFWTPPSYHGKIYPSATIFILIFFTLLPIQASDIQMIFTVKCHCFFAKPGVEPCPFFPKLGKWSTTKLQPEPWMCFDMLHLSAHHFARNEWVASVRAQIKPVPIVLPANLGLHYQDEQEPVPTAFTQSFKSSEELKNSTGQWQLQWNFKTKCRCNT